MCSAHFSPEYFTDRYSTDWGEAINYGDAHAGPVREYFLANAGYWIDEFHFDGLRIDATQNICDTSADHILAAMARQVRRAAGNRATLLVGENEPQHTQLVRPPDQGGYGLDALWNDDFHHSAMVAMTGCNEAYYTDYHGTPQELISALKYGYLYQGQYYQWQQKPRGTPALDLRPAVFVTFLQNHDQIANSGRGLRAHQLTSPGRYKALTAVMLLGPGTPMLFQGQEFAASSPFLYFADFQGDLARLTAQGRAKFLSQFPSLAQPDMQARLRDPADPETFARSKLDLSERQRHAGMSALHRDLLRLRHEDPVFQAQRRGGLDGAVLGPEALVLRFFGAQADDRLLVVNLGRDLPLQPASEPLLAPPKGMVWKTLWSSEDPRYDGGGTRRWSARAAGRSPAMPRWCSGPCPVWSMRSPHCHHGDEGDAYVRVRCQPSWRSSSKTSPAGGASPSRRIVCSSMPVSLSGMPAESCRTSTPWGSPTAMPHHFCRPDQEARTAMTLPTIRRSIPRSARKPTMTPCARP